MMSKIAVYFPGIGYHCDKPLLYYSRSIAYKSGYKDSRTVNYTYKAGNIRGNEAKMKEAYEILFSQAETELADMVWYGLIMMMCFSSQKVLERSLQEHMQKNMV